MRCRSSGPRWSATSRLCARMWSRFAAVQAPSSPTRSGCRGTYRSLRSLPSGIRSQCPAPICTTASASRSAELPGPHAGAGQQFDDEPVTRVGAGPGRGHQPGRVAVVEELRQRLGLLGDVPGNDRIARRRVRPVPLDDSLEELADRAHPRPVRLPADHVPSRPVPAGQPHLVILDVTHGEYSRPR